MYKVILTIIMIATAAPAVAGNNENFDGGGHAPFSGGGYRSDPFDFYFNTDHTIANKAWTDKILAPYDFERARWKAMSRATVHIGWRGVSPGGFSTTRGNFGRSDDFSCAVRC